MIRWNPISIVSIILICLLLLRRCPISKKTRLSENKVSKDGAIPSASKLQKKNALHAKNKRKPNRDDKHEITSLSSQLRMNSQCDEIEAGFEEEDETDDNLVINVASMENKGKALSGSTKRAKVSPKQLLDYGTSNYPGSSRDCILLAACESHKTLPQSAEFPVDVFTSCLTTPIKMKLRWF